MMFFKGSFGNPKDVSGHVNTDQAWTSYIKQSNATAAISTAGSLHHGPEGCQIAGHLQVRKVPGTLRFVLHSPEHDHEHEHINSTHLVNEFWFGDPLTEWQVTSPPRALCFPSLSPPLLTSSRLTSHLLS